MSSCKLAVICKSYSDDDEFLIVQQPRPPKFGDEEYDSFIDSDLWDLPSVELRPLGGESSSEIDLEGAELCPDKLNLRNFDLNFALDEVSELLGFPRCAEDHWRFWKYVEEPEFGPGTPIQTVFIVGQFASSSGMSQGNAAKYQWASKAKCLDWLVEVKRGSDRLGPLVVLGILNGLTQSAKCDIPQSLRYQEYPPGVTLVPMGSRTGKPFHTTNLVVFAPQNIPYKGNDKSFVAHGDALIVDPGCLPQFHKELAEIVASLPRKLMVLVTHHHHDHVDGLSVVQKYNPDAILLAHENTMSRIEKGDWSLGFTSISGDDEICVGGEQVRVIFAPGHTDGHVGLLHVSTNSLIVGDHCVGQGSAVLDVSSGGNMTEYFKTTYKFMELSPHVLIPIHGRVNLWPKHMLCGYLKNRRQRESEILKAIKNGGKTLYDIVASVYSQVDRKVWWYAGSNVRLHVEHLAEQDKLPKSFSLKRFQRTYGLHFFIRWLWTLSINNLVPLNKSLLIVAIAVAHTPSISNTISTYEHSTNDDGFGYYIAPKQLWHSMTDEELMWRASMVPRVSHYPFNRTPKVAFMFLTRGRLPLMPLWETFFKGHKGLFSIYIHMSTKFKNDDEPLQSSVFHKRRIPSKPFEWEKATIMDAERRLLANALLDFSNERFILVSESCIPLFNFSTMYNYSINSNHSHISSIDDPTQVGRGRYNKRMSPTISLFDCRKGSHWFEVERWLAIEIVSDTIYFPTFKDHCHLPCYMDEHYLATLVDWSKSGSQPTTFKRRYVSNREFTILVTRDSRCANNDTSRHTICFPFARKLHLGKL
ncbi:hypothetical protein V2J09_011642 [Rumex salicifolius]